MRARCLVETLAFHESLHFGFSESFPQSQNRGRPSSLPRPPWTRKMCARSGRVRCGDVLRRGGISILEALAVKLPDVFAAEILPKLEIKDTLSLAQVNKAYNAAVWSADGVRSMEAKIKAHFGEQGRIVEPLYWAAKHGNVPAVRARLESGEDVNKCLTHDKQTALHIADCYGHAAVVKALIEAGADVNKPASPHCGRLWNARQRRPQRYAYVRRRSRRPHARRHGAHKGRRGCEPSVLGRLHPALRSRSKWARWYRGLAHPSRRGISQSLARAVGRLCKSPHVRSGRRS